MLRTRLGLFALLGGLAGSSCADLQTVSQGQCGNGFLEAGEECDIPAGAPNKNVCHPVGTPNQCRTYCSAPADCAVIDKSILGWGCGVDHVCRAPTGDFQFKNGSIAAAASSLKVSDFDGDGRADVLSASGNGLEVDYFGDGAVPTKSILVPGGSASPGVGHLVPGKPADFAFQAGQGIGVMLGGADRTFEPVLNAQVSVDSSYALIRMLPMRVVPPMAVPNGVPVLGTHNKIAGLLLYSPTGAQQIMYVLPAGPDQLASHPFGAIADSVPTGCDQFVLAYRSDPAVHVYDACENGVAVAGKNALMDARSSVALPAKREVLGETFLLDLDGDKHLDLLIGARCAGPAEHCVELEVAYGDGAGHFYPIPPSSMPPPAPNTKDQAAPILNIAVPKLLKDDPTDKLKAGWRAYLPLAVGSFNNDGVIDYVDAYGIHISDPTVMTGDVGEPAGYRMLPHTGAPWTGARVADFNRNGFLDVAAASATSAGIDFFNGTGTGLFNPYRIATLGGASDLSLGDFDGDLVTDLAFSVHDPQLGDAVSVAFGQPDGYPTDAVPVAEPGTVLELSSWRAAVQGNPSSTTDLFVVAQDADDATRTNVSLVLGDSSRQLEAPLLFFEKNLDAPLGAAIGRFGAGKEGDGSGLGVATLTVAAPEAGEDAGACGLWYSTAKPDSAGGTKLSPPAHAALTDNGSPVQCAQVGYALAFNPTASTDQPDELVFSAVYGVEDANKHVPDFTGILTVATLDAKGATIAKDPLVRKAHAMISDVQSGDIDGDGLPELLALVRTLQPAGIASVASTSVPASTELLVFWNDKGTLSAPETVPMPGGAQPISMTLINSKGGKDRQLVALTVPGFKHVGEFVSTAYVFSAKARSFAGVTPGTLDQISSGRAVAAGDVDGDGVEDLVLGAFGSIKVYQGVAKNP
jgi:FG-GAP repeat